MSPSGDRGERRKGEPRVGSKRPRRGDTSQGLQEVLRKEQTGAPTGLHHKPVEALRGREAKGNALLRGKHELESERSEQECPSLVPMT